MDRIMLPWVPMEYRLRGGGASAGSTSGSGAAS